MSGMRQHFLPNSCGDQYPGKKWRYNGDPRSLREMWLKEGLTAKTLSKVTGVPL
jgi:hypothetical protein